MYTADPVDQVPRLLQFEAEHPEWQIIAPSNLRSWLRGETDWRASGPDGQFIRERELRDLLDEIARTTEAER